MIDWNSDMDAAPRDGAWIMIRWPAMKGPHGTLAAFINGEWRFGPKGKPLPKPDKWRYRGMGQSGGGI